MLFRSNITLGFQLKTTAGLNTVKIAVNVELQQNGRMIGWPTGGLWFYTLETEVTEIKFINEGVDDSDRIVLSNIIFQRLREQCTLVSVLTFNKTLHV